MDISIAIQPLVGPDSIPSSPVEPLTSPATPIEVETHRPSPSFSPVYTTTSPPPSTPHTGVLLPTAAALVSHPLSHPLSLGTAGGGVLVVGSITTHAVGPSVSASAASDGASGYPTIPNEAGTPGAASVAIAIAEQVSSVSVPPQRLITASPSASYVDIDDPANTSPAPAVLTVTLSAPPSLASASASASGSGSSSLDPALDCSLTGNDVSMDREPASALTAPTNIFDSNNRLFPLGITAVCIGGLLLIALAFVLFLRLSGCTQRGKSRKLARYAERHASVPSFVATYPSAPPKASAPAATRRVKTKTDLHAAFFGAGPSPPRLLPTTRDQDGQHQQQQQQEQRQQRRAPARPLHPSISSLNARAGNGPTEIVLPQLPLLPHSDPFADSSAIEHAEGYMLSSSRYPSASRSGPVHAQAQGYFARYAPPHASQVHSSHQQMEVDERIFFPSPPSENDGNKGHLVALNVPTLGDAEVGTPDLRRGGYGETLRIANPTPSPAPAPAPAPAPGAARQGSGDRDRFAPALVPGPRRSLTSPGSPVPSFGTARTASSTASRSLTSPFLDSYAPEILHRQFHSVDATSPGLLSASEGAYGGIITFGQARTQTQTQSPAPAPASASAHQHGSAPRTLLRPISATSLNSMGSGTSSLSAYSFVTRAVGPTPFTPGVARTRNLASIFETQIQTQRVEVDLFMGSSKSSSASKSYAYAEAETNASPASLQAPSRPWVARGGADVPRSISSARSSGASALPAGVPAAAGGAEMGAQTAALAARARRGSEADSVRSEASGVVRCTKENMERGRTLLPI